MESHDEMLDAWQIQDNVESLKNNTMKKNIHLLVIAFMYVLMSCTDNSKGTLDIDITTCGRHNPEWLLAEIENVMKKSDTYRAVQVHSIQYNTQEYILICDQMNSSKVEGNLLYSCDGRFVNPEESLYEELITLFNEKKYVLLWNN